MPSWWNPLLHKIGNLSVFVGVAWMQLWLESFGADFSGLWLHWEQDGQVVAGCLLLQRVQWIRGIPMRTIFLNSAAESGDAPRGGVSF